jgi:peptide/nickel transport system permease protein
MTVPLLFVVSALTFVLVSLTPGNAAEEILGTRATPEEYAAFNRALGLNLPLYQQYWNWLRHALAGNLGQSIFTGQPVTQAVGQRIPVTLSLLIGALLVSVVIGVGLGVLSALRGGAAGRAIDVLALIGFSLPAFWVGAELIVVFAVWQHWFPATGYVSATDSPAGWLHSLVLPVAALSLYGIAATAKQTREAMLDVLASEYIRIARANGIAPRSSPCSASRRSASSAAPCSSRTSSRCRDSAR